MPILPPLARIYPISLLNFTISVFLSRILPDATHFIHWNKEPFPIENDTISSFCCQTDKFRPWLYIFRYIKHSIKSSAPKSGHEPTHHFPHVTWQREVEYASRLSYPMLKRYIFKLRNDSDEALNICGVYDRGKTQHSLSFPLWFWYVTFANPKSELG